MHMIVIQFSQLFQKDESKHCVWAKSSVVRSKTFPQTEKSFALNQSLPNILKKREVFIINWYILF